MNVRLRGIPVGKSAIRGVERSIPKRRNLSDRSVDVDAKGFGGGRTWVESKTMPGNLQDVTGVDDPTSATIRHDHPGEDGFS
jgi:hypothetical protein